MASKRSAGNWWILALVVLIAGTLFFALGRTQRDFTDPRTLSVPVPVEQPDQIQNTLQAQDGWDRDLESDTQSRTTPAIRSGAVPSSGQGNVTTSGPDTREQTLE